MSPRNRRQPAVAAPHSGRPMAKVPMEPAAHGPSSDSPLPPARLKPAPDGAPDGYVLYRRQCCVLPYPHRLPGRKPAGVATGHLKGQPRRDRPPMENDLGSIPCRQRRVRRTTLARLTQFLLAALALVAQPAASHAGDVFTGFQTDNKSPYFGYLGVRVPVHQMRAGRISLSRR